MRPSLYSHAHTKRSAQRHRPAHNACWRRLTRVLVMTCLGLAASLIAAAGAWAAPANDNFASATPVSTLPFTDTVDPTTASNEPLEPQFCVFSDRTLWYAITPSRDATLVADASGSTAPAQINVYRADTPGLTGLSFLTCSNFGNAGPAFRVQAGKTYYLQVGSLFGGPGSLHLSVDAARPPSNDEFSNATTIGSTPFSETADLTGATVQPGEPTHCPGGPSPATAWYAFTPAVSGSYVLNRSDGGGPLAAFTGQSLSSLREVACTFGALYFHADAQTTYYLQVASSSTPGSQLQLTLDVAPAATASFVFSPSDPSIFDTVQFFDTSFDPAGIGSRRWKLADAITSTDCCPAHRYATDANYTAQLALTTTDGRSATTSQIVPVKTHDIEITKLTVPSRARAEHTKQITVTVANSRYPETVQVSMLRSVAGGRFEDVGQVTQGVPARAKRRTTTFSISYTFSAEDAAIGKVTFKAIATTLTARDAFPADNETIAPATKVTT